jgi:hypothetical protein
MYTLRSDQERLRKMQYSAALHRNRRAVGSIPIPEDQPRPRPSIFIYIFLIFSAFLHEKTGTR